MGKVHILIAIQILSCSLAVAMSPSEKSECLCEQEVNVLPVDDASSELRPPKELYLSFNIFKQTNPHESEEAVCRRIFGMFDDIVFSGGFIYPYFRSLVKNDDVISIKRLVAEQAKALNVVFKTFSNINAFRAALCGDSTTMRLYEERSYALVNGLDGVAKETQDIIYTFLDGVEAEAQGLLNLSGFNESLLRLRSSYDGGKGFRKKLTSKDKEVFYEGLSDYFARIESELDFCSSFYQKGEEYLENALECYRAFYVYVNSKYMMEEESQSSYFWEHLRKKLSERITEIEKTLNYFYRNAHEIQLLIETIEDFIDNLAEKYCNDENMRRLYSNEIMKYIFERQSFLREKLQVLKTVSFGFVLNS